LLLESATDGSSVVVTYAYECPARQKNVCRVLQAVTEPHFAVAYANVAKYMQNVSYMLSVSVIWSCHVTLTTAVNSEGEPGAVNNVLASDCY